jgi:protein ImuB
MARLVELAQDFSPRFECHGDDLVSIDVSGLGRLLGVPRAIGEELRRSSEARGLHVQVALAATQTAAMVVAHARPGVTIVNRGDEAALLAPLAIGILEKIFDPLSPEAVVARPCPPSLASRNSRDTIEIFRTWGIKTLGDLAALPSSQLAARLGQRGLVLQTIARGEDVRPLVPSLPEERFESSIELEWPIDELEPLSFVLTRLLEPLSIRLERRDRGAAVVHVVLVLLKCRENNPSDCEEASGNTYTRRLQLPSPMRDVRTLRTLILLDLESHPPPAAVEGVAVVIEPTPGRVLQHTLFTRAHPTPEQLSTLIARLTALMGADRIGRPALVDSDRPGAFAMLPFATDHDPAQPYVVSAFRHHHNHVVSGFSRTRNGSSNVFSALRRCRHPVPARVSVADGRPAAVTTDRRGFAGGRVLAAAGPWRTSGNWWVVPPLQPLPPWNRDEWDVSLGDGAVYRIFQDRETGGWCIDAIVD